MKFSFVSVLASCLVLVARTFGADVDTSPLPFKTVRAFPEIRIDRPIVVTYPKDDTNRVVVAGQKGDIHIFPNDQEIEETSVFLDITSKVVYKDKQN
ncbi:MAG: hypothetical protein KDA84_21850, partial [Planctomycetaceae bacterium]|nr:hypothetical protein [Planctomycetaceae bacterium]